MEKTRISDAKERNVFYTHQKRNMSNRIHYSSKKEFVLGLLKPKDESLLVCGAGGCLSNLFIKYQILSNIRLLNTYISSSLI